MLRLGSLGLGFGLGVYYRFGLELVLGLELGSGLETLQFRLALGVRVDGSVLRLEQGFAGDLAQGSARGFIGGWR